jgi:sugar-specific transcriptional regulator TrmB
MNNKYQTLATQIEELGLQENEARVYVALLELGRATVTEIAKLANLNRTTGYDILERLCIYGITNRIAVGKKKMYIVEPPHRLRIFLENKKRQVERRIEELNTLMPELHAVYKTDLKPVITFAQGKKEMQNMYHHVLSAKTPVYSIVNLQKYAEPFIDMGIYQADQRTKNKITEKVLALDSNTARYWHKNVYGDSKKRQKYTTYQWIEEKNRMDTAGEINIFDDKVIGILSNTGENVAFEIQSKTVADFMKILFERAWQNTHKKNKKTSS